MSCSLIGRTSDFGSGDAGSRPAGTTMNLIEREIMIDYYYIPNSNIYVSLHNGDKPTKDMIKMSSKAVITKKDEDNNHTMFLVEKGGPVLWDHDIDKLITRFYDAFSCALLVKSLYNYRHMTD